ncbi:hypothetical protein NJ02_000239 [Salmonella enterica]|nr:hypothetical protein [Salmonella enterica]ECD4122554.1 hypothetical protein [Salmonella enterica subsp. enterica serovar Agona]EEV8711281.1 hypothetical protein [Escherichia coli]ECF1383362.1 hypothetical protein [Salmonella enterica subsp. enterica serovar Agona]EED2800424.1 hypothetical protein [Salmonella enterica]
MHGFACVFLPHFLQTAPFPARPERDCATALKPPCKAGGRGGESTARNNDDYDFILSAISSKESKNALTKLSLLTVVKF